MRRVRTGVLRAAMALAAVPSSFSCAAQGEGAREAERAGPPAGSGERACATDASRCASVERACATDASHCDGVGRACATDAALCYRVERRVLTGASPHGLSDLSVDAAGTLWAVAERQRLLVPLSWDAVQARVARAPVRLEGLAPDVDAEALAFLEDGSIAVGTELHRAHESDAVVRMVRVGDSVRARGEVRLEYAPWKLEAKDNRGIEGLCAVGSELVIASEQVDKKRGERFALVARYDGAADAWAYFRVRLTSPKGRLSAVACQPAGSKAVSVLAIERGDDVLRLIRFTLPWVAAAPDDKPTSLSALPYLDLLPALGASRNYEGLAWLPGGALALVTDNSDAREPTELALLTPAPERAPAPRAEQVP